MISVERDSPRYRLYVLVVGLAITRLWLMAMPASLWLDETVTYWTVYKGVGASILRSRFWPGQNTLFMVITAFVVRIAGHSEIAVRLPSLLAGILSVWLIFRLGMYLFDTETGLLACTVFVSMHEVARTFPTARPYSFAVLALLGSSLQLVRWMDRGKNSDAAGYVVLTALIPYIHYLFAICYLSQAIYILYRLRTDSPVRWNKALAAGTTIALLLVPLAWSLRGSHISADSLSAWGGTPHLKDFITAFIPAMVAGGVLLGILLGWGGPRSTGQTPPFTRATAILLFSWLLAPILVLSLSSVLTPFRSFVPRYYMSAFPAWALLVGRLVRGFPPRMRLTLSACIVLSALVSFAGVRHLRVAPHVEDWRAAAQAVRDARLPNDMPVLFRSGLEETSKPNWDLNISPDSPLLCPLSKYPVPGKVFLLPYKINADSLPYLDRLMAAVVQPSTEFVLIARNDQPELAQWIVQESAAKGFKASPLGNAKEVTVLLFKRTAELATQAVITPDR